MFAGHVERELLIFTVCRPSDPGRIAMGTDNGLIVQKVGSARKATELCKRGLEGDVKEILRGLEIPGKVLAGEPTGAKD